MTNISLLVVGGFRDVFCCLGLFFLIRVVSCLVKSYKMSSVIHK